MHFDTKVEALTAGKATLQRMKTQGWEVEAWTGYDKKWRYKLKNGPFKVFEYEGTFHCLCGDGDMSGHPDYSVTGRYDDPNAVVQASLDKIAAVAKQHREFLDAAKQALSRRSPSRSRVAKQA